MAEGRRDIAGLSGLLQLSKSILIASFPRYQKRRIQAKKIISRELQVGI